MKLCDSLAAWYTSSPNVLRNVPSGGITDLVLSSSSSSERGIKKVSDMDSDPQNREAQAPIKVYR